MKILQLTIALLLANLAFVNLGFAHPVHASERNLVVVTIDGLRWQEVFQGVQKNLVNDKTFTPHTSELITELKEQAPEQARKNLMPFLWTTIASNGVLIGDRTINSKMSVANPWYFSYPGYSELFTGVVNPALNTNQKIANPEISFLEYLSNEKHYQNLAVFGSWDVFPYIFNTERSGLYVNAGFQPASGYPLSNEISLLNRLQEEIPSPWENVRLDSFTHRFALDYLKHIQPRVLSISYGETDDFAHDGRYDHYLAAAHRTDKFLNELWQTLQKMPQYKDNTNLLIVTDHGRGSHANDWQHHGSQRAVQTYMKNLNNFEQGIVGANHIWMAALGPDIKALGVYSPRDEFYQSQIASTALTLLDEDASDFNAKAAKPIKEILHD